MTTAPDFEIFLVSPPGLEAVLCSEVSARGFINPKPVTGGVGVRGGGPDLKTAYITLSSTGKVVSLPWARPGLRLNFDPCGP